MAQTLGCCIQQIRRFAIDQLSTIITSLTDSEKIAMARECRIADWLIQGLEGLASRVQRQEISSDELESSVGLRSAYQLLALVMRLPGNMSDGARAMNAETMKTWTCNIGSIMCLHGDHKFFNMESCSGCGGPLQHQGHDNVFFSEPVSPAEPDDEGVVKLLGNQYYLECLTCKSHPNNRRRECGHCGRRAGGNRVRITIRRAMKSTVEVAFREEIEDYQRLTYDV